MRKKKDEAKQVPGNQKPAAQEIQEPKISENQSFLDQKASFLIPEAKPEEQKYDPEEKIDELVDLLQRLQAEFENYKKRVAKESCEFVKIANEELILKLLPVIDNFELALKSCRAKDDFYKGMEIIYAQLIDTLHSQGLKHNESLGKKFDPHYHEVLITEENEQEPNTVTEELQKGYTLGDKVIRHSKVKIAKKKKEDEPSPAGT
jgi:molecular chaperone GrpE